MADIDSEIANKIETVLQEYGQGWIGDDVQEKIDELVSLFLDDPRNTPE